MQAYCLILQIDEIKMYIRWGRTLENILKTATVPVPVLHKSIPATLMNKWHQTPINNSRIVIDGVPGGGKTTFIKRFCYIWAQATTKNLLEEIALTFSIQDQIVIPIILRLIKQEDNLIDILLSQLSFLTVQEACSIISLLNLNPKKLVLLFDGYDELKGSKCINKLLTKENYPEVLCLTTSRPHAIEQLKHLTSQAIDHHIKLCGFSDHQVMEYIQLFFIHHFNSADRAAPLISKLTSERTELLEMAHVPIRCEMICIVWAHYGKLGDTIAELYTLFIIHLLDHMRHKYTPDSRESEQQLMERYHPVLMKIGKLANSWINKGRLCIVFTTQQVQECLGEYFNDAVRIGLITKSHPNSQLEQSQWSFPHLTLQEFMAAYHLAHDDDSEIQEFIHNCKTYRMLKRNEVIFQFLCTKDSKAANKIISCLILTWEDDESCHELLQFVCGLLPHYKPSTMYLPLPRCLDMTKIEFDESDNESDSDDDESDNESDSDDEYVCGESDDENSKEKNKKIGLIECLQVMLDMDRRANLQNLRKVTCKEEDLTTLPNLLGQSYVTECSLSLNEDDQCEGKGLTTMTSLVSLDVNLSHHYKEDRIKRVLNNTAKTTLENLTISGYNIINVISTDITRFTNMKKLTIDEKGSDIREEQVTVLLYNINQCPITNLHCTVPDMYKPFMSHTGKAALSLRIRNLTSKTLHDGVSELRKQVPPVNIHKLDLNAGSSYIDLHDEGGALGELLVRIPHLEVLRLGRCKINKQTVDEMVEQIHKASSEPNLTQLDLSDNDTLSGCGSSLGSLLYHLPHIHTLGLGWCELTSSDLADTAQALPESTNIHNLDLYWNDLEIRQESVDSDSSVYNYNEVSDPSLHDSDEDNSTRVDVLEHVYESDTADDINIINDDLITIRQDNPELKSHLHQSHASDNDSHLQLKNTQSDVKEINNTNITKIDGDDELRLYESLQSIPSTSTGYNDQYRFTTDTQIQGSDDIKITHHEHPADDAVCGDRRLLQHTPRLQALSVGGLRNTDPTRAVCAAVNTGALTHLRILDMTSSKLQTGSLELLGEHLPRLTELKALSLYCIIGVEADDYHHVYKNVPESLQHLNVWSRHVRLDPYLLVEYKHQLRHLHRLNVRFDDDTDLDMVQELMEEHNPHIHVYNDASEIIYEMYVTDKDKDK